VIHTTLARKRTGDAEIGWRPAPEKNIELELELIQTQMAQKPMLRAEVYAHAMRASQKNIEMVPCWGEK